MLLKIKICDRCYDEIPNEVFTATIQDVEANVDHFELCKTCARDIRSNIVDYTEKPASVTIDTEV